MNLELDNNYLEALEVVKKYHKDSIGLTNYEGTSTGDKIYPKQNNLEIALLKKFFCQKLDYINIRLDNLEQKNSSSSDEGELVNNILENNNNLETLLEDLESIQLKVIRRSDSPHRSAAFIVRKHSEVVRGKSRMVINYRRLNHNTREDS